MKHSALSIASRPFVGKALLASLALAGALLLPAQSAVVTATVDPLEPTENILLNTNAIGANLAWNGQGTARAKGHRNVGQSFLATQNAGLESVVFHINDITPAEQALNAAFTLQIFSVTGPAVLPSTAALYTGQGTLPAAMAGNDWLTFKLDSPFQLTAGAYYAVMLSFNDPLTGHSVSLISSPTDTAYANGMGIFYTNVLDNGPLAYVRSMSDFEMILIIPEASSMAMLALGAGLLLVVPRWRRRAFTTTATAAVLIGVMNDPLPAKAEGDTAHTIVLLGDSTVETQKPDSPLQGWGAMLQGQTKAPWQIVNCALSGASTKTFKETPRWQKALATPCRYWFVQFGHNDSHAAGRPESTDAATTYKENLRFYVQEARTRKITPVLVTPHAQAHLPARWKLARHSPPLRHRRQRSRQRARRRGDRPL